MYEGFDPVLVAGEIIDNHSSPILNFFLDFNGDSMS
jgi:hypothetical protein